MQKEHIENIAGLLKTLSHPIRLKIMCLLQEGEKSVGELRSEVKTTNANVSQHLTILRNKGVIANRKDANFIYNRIADPRVLELMQTLRNLYCTSESK